METKTIIEDCRKRIRQINHIRVMISFICGFVVSRFMKILTAYNGAENPEMQNMMIIFSAIYAIHCFLFVMLLFQFREEEKIISIQLHSALELERLKQERNDNDE